MKIRVIVNPSAGAGSAGKKIPELQRLFEARGVAAEILTTSRPGDATSLARDAADSGVEVLGVMGGDGTFNEVIQASLSGDLAAFGPSLALIPAGTGGDFKRSFGLTNDLVSAVERMLGDARQAVDVGVMSQRGHHASPTRAFLNVASVGLSAVVCSLANDGPKWLGGKLTFYAAALRATLGYRNMPLRISVDGEVAYEGPVYLVAAANGRYFGGGMLIAPEASVSDGLFDVVILGDYSKIAAIGLSRAIYAGTHVVRAQTVVRRGRLVEVEPLVSERSDATSVVETDGELPAQCLPITFRVCPNAVSICV